MLSTGKKKEMGSVLLPNADWCDYDSSSLSALFWREMGSVLLQADNTGRVPWQPRPDFWTGVKMSPTPWSLPHHLGFLVLVKGKC